MLKKKYVKLLRIFGLLVLLYLVYSIVYHFVSSSKFTVNEGKAQFKIGNLLNISEDRIEYLGESNFKNNFFSSEAIIDNKYYVIVIRIGTLLDKNKTLTDVINISSKPFSTNNKDNFLTRNDFITEHAKSIHRPYLVEFNTRIFPVKINSLEIYTEKNIDIEYIRSRDILELGVYSKNILFSFNGLKEADLLLSSFKDHESSILIYKDMFNYLYVINFSSKLDIVDGKLKFLASPIKVSEL